MQVRCRQYCIFHLEGLPASLYIMHDIDDSVVPGSVYLVDVQEKTTVVHAGNNSAIVLSPTPSSDINDPLNWSRGRKLFADHTSAIGIGTTMLYSILQPISNDTGIPLATLNAGTGYNDVGILVLGWGALINLPLALTFGKRGIYLISVLGNTAICLLTPYIKTEGQWIASKIVQGYLCTPVESLCEVSIADTFIYDGQGWHWVMYWAAIINFGSLITNFVRNTSEATEAVHFSAKPGAEKDDKKLTTSSPVPSGDLTGIPKTYSQRLALFGGRYASNKLLLTMTYRPVILLRFPVIFWAGFQYGTCLVWYNVLNATCSLILSEQPYNFRANFVGLTYLGPLIGMLLGTFYSGVGGYARRTRGIREPEHRLWLMVVSLLLCPASLILWGVGASKGISWVGLVFGMGIISCSTSIGSSLSINYALDSYKDMSGEVMMAVILVRNTLSFAIVSRDIYFALTF
ncbi:major facilitator superfamily domain-containing protein [Suillus subalutaceus]|uniref:major facilitator superfamily domain-containing protein n=1 Tax=Suillus subalutaceus TaxID=48586 RepID=UPI001B85B68A|nr:major facilitator superfamily domain-containing protein [Suillus subalutaceus]KAG1849260.1 major facilitator superfamily domain-containing protein [Suillus subalutaceus]